MLRPELAVRTWLNGGRGSEHMEPRAKNDGTMGRSITKFIGDQLNGPFDWDYLAEIRALWEGEIYLKGVLHGQDAARAINLGVNGIVVSNHGGRQLDAAPPPLAQLSAVRAAVGKDVPLIVDSGIMSGLDVVRVLAAGADFAMIGRGLCMRLRRLVTRVVNMPTILLEEVRDVMAQLGLQTIDDVKRLGHG